MKKLVLALFLSCGGDEFVNDWATCQGYCGSFLNVQTWLWYGPGNYECACTSWPTCWSNPPTEFCTLPDGGVIGTP